MKDIEKIKSEDLGCQVQDANPGNFAIEQEVAAMVGATVPAPTEPSADDARELGAQLLVFLRRALLPIRSALRTALADIYDYLDSRCTDYTPAAYASYIPRPYDPMGTPRTLPNLLTAITAFADRKIGGVPEAADGISLVHLLSDRSGITKLTDDNTWSDGVTFSTTQQIVSLFPNLESVELGIKELTFDNNNGAFTSSNLTEIKLPHLEVYNGNGLPPGYYSAIVYGTQIEELDLSSLKEINRIASWKSNPCQIAYNCSTLKVVDLSSMTSFLTGMDSGYPGVHFQDCPNIETIKVGKVTSFNSQNFTQYTATDPMTKLVHLEFGEGVAISLNLAYWNPSVALDASRTDLIEQGSTAENNLDQFLQNFLEHICQRLANMTGQTKLTLTLSAAVYTAIMTDNDIKAELVARNWKVTDGSNNFND